MVISENAVPLPVFDLGIAPYGPTQALMTRLSAMVAERTLPGVILLLEHMPVITLGNRGEMADLLDEAAIRRFGIEVAPSERGGQATLHAPGQLVSYPIVPVPRRDIRAFVYDLEEVLRVLLDRLGVAAHRRAGHPGLYVDGEKIASIGLRCRRWVSSHGTSLNVGLDLSLFDLIVSCGEPGLRQTSLEELIGRHYGMDRIKALYLDSARQVFGWKLAPMGALPCDAVERALGVPTAGFEPATPGSGGQCSIP
jgi:lipoyl(octanoyl) transferase